MRSTLSDLPSPSDAVAPQPVQQPAPRPIRFLHRGRLHSVSGLPPTTTVLQWLREHAHCSGTKEGCAEGDCGACTVMVAEPVGAGFDPRPGTAGAPSAVVDGLLLRTVNACIQFLPTLDGKALITVEDLKGSVEGGALHPAQDAMVRCHGSQCGFCTPGFVMSLACLREHHLAAGTRPTRAAVADALAGNLCRCTGYRPILDAGEQMFDAPGSQPPDAPSARLDTAALHRGLAELAADAPLHYAAASAAAPGRIDRFHAPRSLDELAQLREAMPQARLLAGSTDIGLWVTKQFRDLGDVIDLNRVAELKRIENRPAGALPAHGGTAVLRIGAAVSLEDAWAALADSLPPLRELWLRFASPPVRHAGTLVGNLANGSPIGDGPPVMLALDAALVLRRGSTQRVLPLDGFYLDYMRNALQPGEFIEAVEVPLPGPSHLRAYKVSKRYDSDISAVCGGFALSLAEGRVASVRLAFGGLAATVRRATGAEAALHGQPWNAATVAAGMAALSEDFKPLTDMRASADYRLRVARNLLQRLWLETRPDAPLPAGQVSVWDAARALADPTTQGLTASALQETTR